MSVNGVRQLKRVILNYCHWGGSSMFMRDFLKSAKLIRFAEANSELEIIARKRKGHPFLLGEYVNGTSHQICVKNQPDNIIISTLYQLRNRSGRLSSSVKYWQKPRTLHPSIQGRWTPTKIALTP
uniref:Large ribosomal subunit protein mL43 n=1 Tax=Spongospora subterranea TaxID=70186 RepID=A0A0H5R5L7_9EUKA|eukprot:CRZ09072.1 hypothetical protein [Spongospora subterranea]